MVNKKLKILITIIIILVLIGTGIFADYLFFQKGEIKDFELDTLFMKVAINEEGSSVNNIKIINTDYKPQSFSVKVNELEDFISLEEEEFELGPQEEYTIKLVINGKDKEPGVYLGELEISSDTTKKVPIILEIQSKEVLFDGNVNIYPQGKDFVPGEKLNAEIKIFDLAGIGKDNIKLIYFIKSFDGRTIASESEDLVVDEKLDYSKTLDLPKSIRLGDYVLIVIIKYDGSVGTSSQFFKVVEEQKIPSENNLLIIIIVVFGLFFVVFLGLFIYSIFYRDKLLLELQNQYKGELRRQGELISSREKIDYTKLRTSAEKREYKRQIERIKKERLRALESIHKKRIKEYIKIKKKGKKNQLKKQISVFKRNGYDTAVLERKYKIPSAEMIKKRVNEWKKKGYDTSVLEKRIKK